MLRASTALVLLASIALAACQSPQPARPPAAAGPPPNGEQLFARIDANSDGKIDQAEFATLQQVRFRQLDADQSGTLTETEMQSGGQRRQGNAQRQANPHQRFVRLDTNANGTLTEEEYLAGQMAMMTRLDADQDGAISADEFSRLTEALAGRA